MNSLPTPRPACTVLKLNSRCIPRNQARNATPMNRPILTLRTGTPTARALAALPPAAVIQLPVRVRSSSQVATATNSSHHSTVILTVMNPRPTSEANIAQAAGVGGGDRPGDQLGDAEVEALQDEERAQRDEEAGDPGSHHQVPVDEP